MSYNLLADHMALPKYFPYASPQVLDFRFRGPRLIEEIGMSNASLICLQEVDQIDDFYEPQLKKLGFILVYGDRELFGMNTIAVCYKASEWVHIDTELFDLSDLAYQPPNIKGSKKRQGMLCLFKHIASN